MRIPKGTPRQERYHINILPSALLLNIPLLRRMLCLDATICQAGEGRKEDGGGGGGDTQFPKSTPTSAAVIKPEPQKRQTDVGGSPEQSPGGAWQSAAVTQWQARHAEHWFPRNAPVHSTSWIRAPNTAVVLRPLRSPKICQTFFFIFWLEGFAVSSKRLWQQPFFFVSCPQSVCPSRKTLRSTTINISS